jgi:hypothetical protein
MLTAVLTLLTVMVSVASTQLPAPHLVYPEGAQILDVKRDFGAKGDGQTNDTAALQAAIVAQLSGDYRNPRMIYLPKGVYLVSDTLKSRITDAPPGEGGWCDGWRSGTFVVGESRDETLLRLKDSAAGFDNPNEPKPVLVNGSTGHGKGHDSRIGGWGNKAFQR